MSDRSVAEMTARGMARQMALLGMTLAGGAPRIGWKIGINDPAFQRLLGLSGPVVGWLNGNCVLGSGDCYAAAPSARLFVEAEVAIGVSADVPPGLSDAEAGEFISTLAPAIELIDYSLSTDSLEEVLANSVLHAGVVFGAESDIEPSAVLDSRWPRVAKNGASVRQRHAGLGPDNFGSIIARVATLVHDYGEGLLKGDRIISGSFVEPLRVASGDHIHVDFGALGIVEVSIASDSG